MKILSLFDGMSCGYLAMLKANKTISRYVAYEIDKYAVKTAQHNCKCIEECGDVFKADFSQYKGFDYIVGGSPCTYWSIARTTGRETTASGMGWELFSQYVRAVKEAQPRYFIYENNKSMSKDIRQSICEAFGFEPILINSALVSAQKRERLYWVGVRQPDGTYRRANIPQPDDKGIMLLDVLDGNYGVPNTEKAFVLTASYNGAVAWNTIERSQRTMVAVRVSDPIRVGEYPNKDGILSTSQGQRIYSADGKAVPINTGKTKTGFYSMRIPEATKGKTIYKVKDGKITIKGKQYPIKLIDGYYIIRKLSVAECKRLQTVPEW